MRKLLLCVIMMMVASSAYAEEFGTFSGKWNIYGEGFAEKGIIRTQLEYNGDMNISACGITELPADVVNIYGEDWETLVSRDSVLPFFDCLTGLDMSLKVYASSLEIKVMDEYMPNQITDPYLFLDIIPSLNEPLELPELEMDRLTIQITLTSETAGKMRVVGTVDSGTVLGNVDINTECVIWKDGTARPAISSGGSSGCNSGLGVVAMMMLLAGGLKKFVRD